MTACPDCAKVADDVPPLRRACAFHALMTGNGSPLMRQALAAAIDPKAFEAADQTHRYFSLHLPAKPDKTVAYERRAIEAAYAAADRVGVLVG